VLTRARRWLAAEAAFVVVLAVLATAFIYLLVAGEHWRRGVGLVTVALVVAAVLRATLPDHRAGMLAVRTRWFDALCYAALGVVILVAAIRVR
jgi:Protein of unknown function (DUF3017)